MECLVRHKGFANLPSEHVVAEYKFAILGAGHRDHEFGLELPFLHAYSGETIRVLQSVLHDFPGWTLVLGGHAECMRITINEVLTEEGIRIADVDQHMVDLRSRVAVIMDRSIGVTERQYRWLMPRIPELLEQLRTEKKRALVAGMFDRVPRKDTYYAVWLLRSSKDQCDVMASGHKLLTDGNFPVDNNGTLFRHRYRIEGNDKVLIDTPFQLNCSNIPKSYAGDRLQIVDYPDVSNVIETMSFNRATVVADDSLPKDQ
eukprot:TRINITY_DN256_c0_g1_i3.p2 TRINITY_DN256_c0_g1~~TRINITY_DN256_c0_g1_i3.p2  ORF type:complete len:259 (-),score=26.68 TRINITY_DN256_c0_g1_i3:792-1568(-)